MKKGFGIFVILGILIASFYVLAIDPSERPYGSCIPDITPSVCGEPILATIGQYTLDGYVGGVEICGECYVCGDWDGVCPEDFEDANTGTIGDCSGCNDPDCNASISGHVYALGDGNPPFLPLNRAVVRAVSANPTLPEYYSQPTDSSGFYVIGSLPSGHFYVAASLEGYDTEIQNITLENEQDGVVDFYLPNGTCNDDCTDYFGRCANCHGVKGCWYDSMIAQQLCMGHRSGNIVPYTPPDASHMQTNILCCEGNITLQEYRPPAAVEGCMENLITVQLYAILDGQPVVVNIAVWPPGEC